MSLPWKVKKPDVWVQIKVGYVRSDSFNESQLQSHTYNDLFVYTKQFDGERVV